MWRSGIQFTSFLQNPIAPSQHVQHPDADFDRRPRDSRNRDSWNQKVSFRLNPHISTRESNSRLTSRTINELFQKYAGRVEYVDNPIQPHFNFNRGMYGRKIQEEKKAGLSSFRKQFNCDLSRIPSSPLKRGLYHNHRLFRNVCLQIIDSMSKRILYHKFYTEKMHTDFRENIKKKRSFTVYWFVL